LIELSFAFEVNHPAFSFGGAVGPSICDNCADLSKLLAQVLVKISLAGAGFFFEILQMRAFTAVLRMALQLACRGRLS
jgi:hypothetical protein